MNVPLIIGIIILLTGLGGGGYWYFFMRRVYEGPSECETVYWCNKLPLASPDGLYSLQFLKTGNLVILDKSGKVTWESKSSTSADNFPLNIAIHGQMGTFQIFGPKNVVWDAPGLKSINPATPAPWKLALDNNGKITIKSGGDTKTSKVLWSIN